MRQFRSSVSALPILLLVLTIGLLPALKSQAASNPRDARPGQPQRDLPEIAIEPQEIEVDLGVEQEVAEEAVNVQNVGNQPLTFETNVEIINEPERDHPGSHRDQPESHFALFQDVAAWRGNLWELVLDQVEGLEYVHYTSQDFDDFPIDEFGVVWVVHSEQTDAYNTAYNNNRARFEEWVDAGGAYYASTGTNQYNVVPIHPGGLRYTRGGTANGTVRVTGDQQDENYNYLAELMDWEVGTALQGNALFHVHYEQQGIDNLENSDWNQTLVTLENQAVPGIVAYSFGSGFCVVGGVTDGHQQANFAQPPNWGSAGEELCYYLDYLASTTTWITVEPTEGRLNAGADMDVVVTLTSVGLIGGDYEADLHFLSNDRNDPDLAVSIIMHVTGAPNLSLRWPDEYGYPDVLDWNLAFEDLFFGGPYVLIVNVLNDGTDALVIENVSCENEFFFSNFGEESILEPNERVNLEFTFNADEAGDYDAEMVFLTNDPGGAQQSVALHARALPPPFVEIEPAAVEDELNTGERSETIINVRNAGEADLRFTTEIEIISEPERDRLARDVRQVGAAGPRRDDPGDLIAQFNGPNAVNQYWSPVGWDPDNDVMFFTGYAANTIAVWTHENYEDFREVRRFATPNPMDGGWYNGVVYVCNLNVNNVLRRFDIDGNNLGDLAMGYSCYGVAFDHDEGLMLAREQAGNNAIHVYEMDGMNRGREIGQITNYLPLNNNIAPYAFDWVSRHPEGQLWLPQTPNLNQIAVNTDDWQCTERVASFAAAISQPYDAPAHDGHNIWVGGYANGNVRIYDDGVAETYWLTIEPTDGVIEQDNDMDLVLLLDATGLISGDYEAELHFITNDPNSPDEVVAVTLTVNGASDITLDWPDEAGAPDVVDWNRYHPDVFVDHPLTVPITIENIGVEPLNIENIVSDNEFFTVDRDQLEIPAGEEAVVQFRFLSDEVGEWEAEMIIESDDPDQGEITVPMRAQSFSPPVLGVEPNAVEDNLNTGETSEFVINLNNAGENALRWEADIEILEEPDRDAASRDVRQVDKRGPQRDDPGDLIAQFNGPNVVNQYWSPVGYDAENDQMAITSYTASQIAIWTHDDYQNFRRVRSWAMPNPMDGAVFEGVIYANQHGQAFLHRWDFNGNALPQMNVGFVFYGVAIDHDNGWIMFRENIAPNQDIRVYEFEGANLGRLVGRITNYLPFNNNVLPYTMEWVSRHPEGQLWLPQTPNLNQIAVNTENWQATGRVLSFNAAVTQPYDGCAHDGHNLWIGGYANANFRIYDDGVAESYWIDVTPRAGEIEAESDQDLILALNATDLFSGEYIAELHILSNDPVNPDVVVDVSLTVQGFPVPEITWAEAAGFPDVLNYNFYYEDLFAGGPYPIEVTIANLGTDDLTIANIVSDSEIYYTDWDPDQEAVVPGGEEAVVNFYYDAPEARFYEGHITISFEDFLGQEFEPVRVWVQGRATRGPEMIVEPEFIEDELNTGERSEHVMTLVNEGAVALDWQIEPVIVDEPGDDAVARDVRSVRNKRRGPERDDLGEVLARPVWNSARANQYKAGIAWDGEAGRMWLTTYSPNWITALNPEDDFAEVVRSFQPAGQNPMGAAWLDGSLFVVPWANQFLGRWNDQQQNIGNFNLNFQPTAVTASAEEGLLFIMDAAGNRDLHVMRPNGEEITTFSWKIGPLANLNSRGICWVDEHPHGQLWVSVPNHVYQVAVDTDNWEAVEIVQDFAYDNGNNEWSGLGHDYDDLWLGPYPLDSYLIVDDATTEVRWLLVDHDEGVIAPGSDEDIIIDLNAEGLVGGDYRAELQIFSNDPIAPDGLPDFIFPISLSVIGVPEILVLPGGEGEDPVDFEVAYFDYPISRTVQVINPGTDDLILQDVVEDQRNPDFFVRDEDLEDFVIIGGERRDLTIWYDPDRERGGRQRATLQFISNDPNQEDGYAVTCLTSIGAFESPVFIIEPVAFEYEMDEGQTQEAAINLANMGGSMLRFATDIEVISEPERDRSVLRRDVRSVERIVENSEALLPGPRSDDAGWNNGSIQVRQPDLSENRARGPRRDVPEGRGMLIQERNGWGHDFEQYFSRIEGFDYDRYRTWGDVADVDFFDYDFMWIGNYESEAWVAEYNRNLERIEEWVAGGGALYHCSGTNNHNTRPVNPGGLVYVGNASENDCPLMVNPDENWLIDYMNENDPFGWEWRAGQLLHGNGNNHGTFTDDGMEAIENCDWYQVIARGAAQRQPIIAVYTYGRGWCLVSTTTDGFLHNSPQQYHWGRTAEGIIYYLDFLAHASRLVSIDPDEGEIEPDSDLDIVMTLNTEELEGGLYETAIHFLSNDPENPDQVVTVEVRVTGIPAISGDPLPYPLEGAQDIALPGDYFANGEYNFPISIQNIGSQVMQINDVSLSDAENWAFEIVGGAREIPDRSEVRGILTFQPQEANNFEVEVRLTTNAANVENGQVWWNVTASAGIPPEIGVELDAGGEEIAVRMRQEDDPVERFLTISNRAGQNAPALEWQIDVIDLDEGVVEDDSLERDAAGPVRELLPYNPVQARLNLGHGGWIPRDDGEVGWMTVEPVEGEIEAGAQAVVTLTFSAAELEDGEYQAMLLILSNDPDRGQIDVPITLAVGEREPRFYRRFEITDINHSLLIDEVRFNNEPAPDGWEVGVFTPDGVLSGAAVWEPGHPLGMAAWAAEDDNGQFENGDRLTFRMWDSENRVEYEADASFVEGPFVWIPNGASRLSLDAFADRRLTVRLAQGWNMISINVNPNQFYNREISGLDIEDMFEGLRVNQGNHRVEMLKDDQGRFWSPAWDFLNIPCWTLFDGYQIKVTEDVVWQVTGDPMRAQASLPLYPGWNMIAYLPTYNLDASAPDYLVLSEIINFVAIAKDNQGRFMMPAFDFSNMPPWTPGQGYQVRINSEQMIALHYPLEPEDEGDEGVAANTALVEPSHWTQPVITDNNMSLLVRLPGVNGEFDGGEIGAFSTSGRLTGSGCVDNGVCGLAIWGDEPGTEEIEGLRAGEAFTLKIWNRMTRSEDHLRVSQVFCGKGLIYLADEMTVVDATIAEVIPEAYFLSASYPNPFNSVTRLQFGLPEGGWVRVKVFDLDGREVAKLAEGDYAAGSHAVVWSADHSPAGIYIVRLEANGCHLARKVALIK